MKKMLYYKKDLHAALLMLIVITSRNAYYWGVQKSTFWHFSSVCTVMQQTMYQLQNSIVHMAYTIIIRACRILISIANVIPKCIQAYKPTIKASESLQTVYMFQIKFYNQKRVRDFDVDCLTKNHCFV